MDSKIIRKIAAGSLPKAMSKINLKITTKNAFESDFGTKRLTDKTNPKLCKFVQTLAPTKLIQNFCKCKLTALQQNDSSMDVVI